MINLLYLFGMFYALILTILLYSHILLDAYLLYRRMQLLYTHISVVNFDGPFGYFVFWLITIKSLWIAHQ